MLFITNEETIDFIVIKIKKRSCKCHHYKVKLHQLITSTDYLNFDVFRNCFQFTALAFGNGKFFNIFNFVMYRLVV